MCVCVCVTLSSKYTLSSAGSDTDTSWYGSAEQAKSDEADLSPHLRLQTSKEMFEPVESIQLWHNWLSNCVAILTKLALQQHTSCMLLPVHSLFCRK